MTDHFLEQLRQDAVYALAGANGTLYAARASGLYQSSDGGARWRDLLAGQGTTGAVTAVAVSGATVIAARGGAILRSEDSGAGWHESPLTQPPPTVTALALSPDYANDRTAFAATAQDGVFVSTDGGARWIGWNYGLIDLNVNALALSPDFAADRTLLAGTESGLFRSRNGGRSWREVDFPLDAAPVLSVGIAAERLLVGTERGLWVSDGGGAVWTRVENVPSAVQAIQPRGDQVWLLLEDRLICSADGATSWRQVAALPPEEMATAFLPDVGGTVMVGFADGDLVSVDSVG